MIPRELIKKIRQIQIRTRHTVNDLFAGHYHSAFKGLGMEFEEVREYQPGDDVRSIDWNVTARTGHPFIKTFREERELTVILVVDISRSQFFGTAGQLKRELTTELCATLAFSAIKNNDKVGLILFTDRVELFVPAKKGIEHVIRVIRELLYYEPQGTRTDIAAAIQRLNRVTTRRAVVFLVSDFQTEGYDRVLRIARRRHDLIPICVTDPREVQLPNVGFLELIDNETGRRVIVDTASRAVQAHYTAQAIQRDERLHQLFRRMDVDPVYVTTGQSFVEPLTRFFIAREARR